MPQFSVFVLLYGDHLELAQRCLGSLGQFENTVRDLVVICNRVSPRVAAFTRSWRQQQQSQTQATISLLCPVWSERSPATKYPVLRWLLRETQPAEYVMWFDDDSYLSQPTLDWWQDVLRQMAAADVLGQLWQYPMSERRWAWVRTQSWCNRKLPRTYTRFPQGAWWCARRDFLRQHNWPFPELQHCGGDSLLGELCRHVQGRLQRYDRNVRINADERGRHSRSKRRGFTQAALGESYSGKPLPLAETPTEYIWE